MYKEGNESTGKLTAYDKGKDQFYMGLKVRPFKEE